MKRGLFQILIANLIYLFVSVFNAVVLPKFLTVETYAMIKTYTLYVGYAGFFSLGFVDSMYIKYGGVDICAINAENLGKEFRSFLCLELILAFVALFYGVYAKDFIICAFAAGMFFTNTIGFHKTIFQASGEFSLYSRTLNYQSILLTLGNLIFVVFFRSNDYHIYVAWQVICVMGVAIVLTVRLKQRKIIGDGKANWRQIPHHIANGFTLMLGSFSNSIFTSMDRWFVKILMNSFSFAMYSFAVSIENLITVFVTPITVALYNVFCRSQSDEYILRIKRLTLIWGCMLLSLVYPVRFVLERFLVEYVDSTLIIVLLFATQPFYAVIKGIYVNLYKANKRQHHYFVIMMIMTCVAFLTNVVTYLVYNHSYSFAIATLATSIIWFAYSEAETRAIRFRIKDYLFLVCIYAVYFFSNIYLECVPGFVIYVFSGCLGLYVLMNDTSAYLWKHVMNPVIWKEILHRKERR